MPSEMLLLFVLNRRSIEDLLCPTTIWSGSPRIEISSYFVDLPSFTLVRLLWFKFSLPDKYKVLAQELNRNIEKQHKYSDSLIWIACIFISEKFRVSQYAKKWQIYSASHCVKSLLFHHSPLSIVKPQ